MIEYLSGSTAELVGVDLPDDREGIYVLRPSDTAFVLGSATPDGLVDRAAADSMGAGVVRRRSGGGVVVVAPDDQIWFDVVVPAAHPRFDREIGTSGLWLGEAVAGVLTRHLGDVRCAAVAGGASHVAGTARRGTHPSLRVARRGVGLREWGTVCFAAVGPGEVVVDEAVVGEVGQPGPSRSPAVGPVGESASKLVGVSQRRTRRAARFQVAIPRRWDPDRWLPALALGAASVPVGRRLHMNVAWLDMAQERLASLVAQAVAEALAGGSG